MNLKNGRLRRTLNVGSGIALLFAMMTAPVVADVRDIKALFEPDASKPQKNAFVNKTPSEGFCNQIPAACEPSGLFSLIARIRFTANAPILANHADPRQGGMAKVPSDWRDVSVTHSSGDSKVVQVRIAGIGHEASIPRSIRELTGGGSWDQLWEGGGWVYAPPPCGGVGWLSAGEYGYNSFWKVPVGAGVCSKKAKFDIPLSFAYQYVVFGYELRTPDPLNMQSGDYTGTIRYTVGPGLDFDMGDVMIPNDNQLTLNFHLEVRHTLKVDIPPGGDRVELVPQGGWQTWLTQGRKPTRLFRDQTFNISSSSRFKMQLQCEIPGLFDCMIRDPVSQRAAVVQLSVSLPNGLTDISGQPVKRRPLHVGDGNAQEFKPGFYLDRAPGILHFEIAPYYVNYMIKPGEASRYSGNITVIWDSDIG
jgi:hypothetical protein